MIKEGSKLEAIYDDILNIIALGRKKGKWTSIEQLIENIEEVPSKHPPNQEVLNITKRCVKLVYSSPVARTALGQSNYGIVGFTPQTSKPKTLNEAQLNELKDDVLEAVRSAKDGLDLYTEDISKQSMDYLKPNDKIIVWGYDELVAAFIDYAISSRSRKTSVTLMVTGSSSCAKKYLEKFRKKIESQILQVVLIGDGGFFSVMPIVQKVVVSIRSLLPNGSLRVDAGLHSVCLAARQHAVPVIGLCPMHKVSFSHPMDVVELVSPDHAGEIKPEWDLVKSNLVSLIITPESALPPSDTYRLHNDLYAATQ